ncbi:MAG: hypothetical protein LBQ27_02900 [Clostridiales bacterium]|jgi:hypothetical protein|nr:hypothetical protein [Clostridiales bacterium]
MNEKHISVKRDAEFKTPRLQKIGARNALIDNVKGLVVLLYMVDHMLIHMPKDGFHTPAWANHSNPVLIPSWGFNIIDLGPILFFFVIGFVFFSSFIKKYEREGRAAYKQVFLRNTAFMGVFLGLFYFAGAFDPPASAWNTVPSIGFASLLVIPFLTPRIAKSPILKTLFAIGILLFYHFNQDSLFELLAYIPVNTNGVIENTAYAGGMAACIGYAAVILLSGAIADVSKKGIIPYAILTAALWVFGRFIYLLDIPSFPSLNAAYMVSALSKINLFYFGFYVLDKLVIKGKRIPLLSAMGRNIMLYLLLVLILQAVFALTGFPKAHNEAEAWIIIGVITVFYILLAIPLEKSKIVFKL